MSRHGDIPDGLGDGREQRVTGAFRFITSEKLFNLLI